MEEINYLKLETAVHLFPKLTHIEVNVFDSCLTSFFACTNVGWGTHPTAWFGEWVARRAKPGHTR
jgi:hypothetical protein